MKIHVSKENLQTAWTAFTTSDLDDCHCPIELAFLDIGFEVHASTRHLHFVKNVYVRLPDNAINLIAAFDHAVWEYRSVDKQSGMSRYNKIQPITFEIDDADIAKLRGGTP